MSDYTRVYFPGLGWEFDVPAVAFTIGNFSVRWYGIIIALGFTLAVLYGGRYAYKWKMSLDGMTDVLLWGTCFGIIGARLYYVIMEWDYYGAHPGDIIKIWEGGIAIYGGIIGGVIGAAIACRLSKVDFRNLLDLGALGFLIGQGIGRWGNFTNQEAFGSNTTTAPLRMYSSKIADTLSRQQAGLAERGMEVDPSLPVHPTFFYESVWCLLGFAILHVVCHRHRKFKGEIFLLYGIWYGLGRMVIEGMRTDSLYLWNTNIRTSQALSVLIVVVFTILLVYQFVLLRKGKLPGSARLEPDFSEAAGGGKDGCSVEPDGEAERILKNVEFQEMEELREMEELEEVAPDEGIEPEAAQDLGKDGDAGGPAD